MSRRTGLANALRMASASMAGNEAAGSELEVETVILKYRNLSNLISEVFDI
jgi:hypothetical protein